MPQRKLSVLRINLCGSKTTDWEKKGIAETGFAQKQNVVTLWNKNNLSPLNQ